jgi:hypothetical protein
VKKKILILVTSLLCCYVSFSEAKEIFSNRVFLTSVLIQLISTYYIFSNEDSPYSLNKIFYLFTLFFLGIAPLLQFYNATYFFSIKLLSEVEYFLMNLLILFIILIYQILYSWFYKVKLTKKAMVYITKFKLNENLNALQISILILISLFSFFTIFYINNFSIISMLVRGGEIKEHIESTGLQDLVFTQFIRPLSMVSFLYFCLSKNSNPYVFVLLLVLALLTCFPLAMPRFNVGALYIPFLIILIPIFRKKHIFSISLIFSLLVLFPFLDKFRNISATSEIDLDLNFKMFTEAHFDSYNNFGLIVTEDIVTYGRQLLGVLLFWLPRVFWQDKPIGSGAFLADKLNFSFSNVSANFFAEGYINFGLIGIILFLIALAFFTARMDKLYWSVLFNQRNNFFKVIYLIILGMLFLVLRGDLMSSFAFTCGFMLAIFVVFKVSAVFKAK